MLLKVPSAGNLSRDSDKMQIISRFCSWVEASNPDQNTGEPMAAACDVVPLRRALWPAPCWTETLGGSWSWGEW